MEIGKEYNFAFKGKILKGELQDEQLKTLENGNYELTRSLLFDTDNDGRGDTVAIYKTVCPSVCDNDMPIDPRSIHCLAWETE